MEENTFETEVELELSNYPDSFNGVDKFYFNNSSGLKTKIKWEYSILHRSYGIASISPRVITNLVDISAIQKTSEYIEEYLSEKDIVPHDENYKIKFNEQVELLNRIKEIELVEVNCEVEPTVEGRSDLGLFPVRIEIDMKTRTGIIYFQSTAP